MIKVTTVSLYGANGDCFIEGEVSSRGRQSYQSFVCAERRAFFINIIGSEEIDNIIPQDLCLLTS